MLAWTTVATREDAERLAISCVSARLVACAQIDGPITSVYRWEDLVEQCTEYRLTLKCLPANIGALETHVLADHPYATPEWIVCEASQVSEKYLSWARTNAQSRPF